MKSRRWIQSFVLLITVLAAGAGLAAWKATNIREANAASATQHEPVESITVAIAKEQKHQPTTTSIGTIVALRSITLQNELAGTVRQVLLTPGQIVEAGAVLVTLDVSVEQAELEEQQARSALAKTLLGRLQSVSKVPGAISQTDLDRASAELDVAQAQVARTKAVIARKTIRAPFRARVGISNVHIGQYLHEGTELTTLQGVDKAAYVDFAVAQQVAAGLRPADTVEVFATSSSPPARAKIVAVDARIDHTTRNAVVRAQIETDAEGPAPGASVRVRVPVGKPLDAVAIPASALRKDPGGDSVFVISKDKNGNPRAHTRQVEAGTMIGDEVLVLSGLKAGEQVADSGSFKLREEALVAIASEAGADTNGNR